MKTLKKQLVHCGTNNTMKIHTPRTDFFFQRSCFHAAVASLTMQVHEQIVSIVIFCSPTDDA